MINGKEWIEAREKELLGRLRRTAQTLIDEIGAEGPLDAEDAARRAVEIIVNLKGQLAFHRDDISAVCRNFGITEEPEPGTAFARAVRHARHWLERSMQYEKEIDSLRERIAELESDVENIAYEFRIDPAPEPGSDMAKLLQAAKSARTRSSTIEDENLKLLREIDEWKDASGLLCGDDPDGVRPEDLRSYIKVLESIRDNRDQFVIDAQRDSYQSAIAICFLVHRKFASQMSNEPYGNIANQQRARGAEACIEAIKESIPVGYGGRKIDWKLTSEETELARVEAWPEHPRRPHITVEMRRSAWNATPFACVYLERQIVDKSHLIVEVDVPISSEFNYGPCPYCKGPDREQCPYCCGSNKNLLLHAQYIASWMYYQWLAEQPVIFGHKAVVDGE